MDCSSRLLHPWDPPSRNAGADCYFLVHLYILTLLGDKSLYTIPIATQAFYGTYSTDIGLVMAALLLAMLPILILYLFLQKYIVAGVTSGAVKG